MLDSHFTPSSSSLAPCLSRRTTLKMGGLGFAAVASLKGLPVVAQQDELPEPFAAFVAGWEALDADQIAGTYAEEGIAEDAPGGVVTQGREAIRSYLTDFFAAFSAATVEVPTAFATDEYGALVWVFSANYSGTVPGFPPGEGQLVTVQGVTIAEFANDEIQRTTEYYDVYGILIQLGVVPTPEEGATPEATPAG